MTFAFICIDKGQSRKEIIELLIQLKIPFIDVEIELERQGGSLSGIVRTTYSPVADAENVLEKNWVPTNDKQIKTGWKAEENKRKKYYKRRSKKQSIITKIITWLHQ
ncbi:MAG TPA: hypothetical protein VFI29_23370 [Hanamia sp.]|nr:hypothetical protein [Hanamia sp.]